MAFTLNNNDFLASLTNLCLQVVTFDSLSFRAPFSVFKRKYTKFGDKIACVNAFAPDGEDYALSTNPYAHKLPTVSERTINTTLKRRYPLTLAPEILKGAFEDDNSLGLFISVLQGQLLSRAEIDIYNQICKDLGSAAFIDRGVSTDNIDVINALPTTAEEWQAMYTKLINAATAMDLPNESYKPASAPAGTTLRAAMNTRKVLVVTPEVAGGFNTFVKAWLLNSDKVTEKKFFDEIIVARIHDPDNVSSVRTVAAVMTEDVYRYSSRIEQMVAMPQNAADLSIPYYYHVWTNMGATGAGQVYHIAVG